MNTRPMPVRPVILIPLVVVVAFTFAACSSTFLVTKDGQSCFFGSGRTEMRAMLCDSGDLMRVLTDTDLDVKVRHTLYIAMCVEPSKGKGQRGLRYPFQGRAQGPAPRIHR